MPINIDNTAFKKALNDSFRNKIHKKLFHSLANLLTLDYALRLKITKPIDVHITECITRIKKYIAGKIINDCSFRTVMLLFVIAISPEDSQIKKNNLTRQNTAKAVANTITHTDFSEYSSAEREVISKMIESLISNNPLLDMLNFIRAEPKLFREIISTVLLNENEKQNNDMVAKLNIGSLVEKSVVLDKKIGNLKCNVTNMTIVTAAIASAVLTAGVSTFLILPAVALSIKYGAKLGARLSNKLISYNKAINHEKHSISETKSRILSNMQSLDNKLSTSHKVPFVPKRLRDQELDVIKNQLVSDIDKAEHIDHEVVQNASRQNIMRNKIHNKGRV